MSDKIYILENGRIVEDGTHNQLMEMDGSMPGCLAYKLKNIGNGLLTQSRSVTVMDSTKISPCSRVNWIVLDALGALDKSQLS